MFSTKHRFKTSMNITFTLVHISGHPRRTTTMQLTSRLFLLFVLCTYIPVKAEIPIIAFAGVPPHESTAARFKEFREAGFDVSIENYWDLPPQRIKNILDIANQQNIRLMVKSNLLQDNPKQIVRYIKGHPALYAYYIEDEPMPDRIEETRKLLQIIRKEDSVTRCYLNLLPTYGIEPSDDNDSNMYEQYLRQASNLSLPQISFDHYPITTKGIRKDWYRNLEAVRQESLRTGKPFWAFVLCTPHIYYPQPTLASLRLQIYSNLVYGAQGIQYFTYWTPSPTSEYDYHQGPIGTNGERTKTYDLVKCMNEELRQLTPLFDGAVIESIGHLVKIPKGTTKATKMPLNIRKLKVKGKDGCIVSTLKKGNHLYLAIVNKDEQGPLTLTIKAKNGVHMLNKNLEEKPLQPSYQMSGGNMFVFKLK